MSELLQMTMGETLELRAKEYPDTEALVSPYLNVRFTYKELNAHVDVVARGFIGMGIKKGDHVSIWSTNYPEWIITRFACAKIGAVLVTVNTNYKKFEL